MLLKLGTLAVEVAGSVGGLTLQRSPTGTVGRAKPIPIQRKLRAGSTARQVLANAVRAWQSLSPEQREAWELFAAGVPWFNRFGDPVAGNGYRAFMRCNSASYVSPILTDLVPPQLDPPVSWASTLPAAPLIAADIGTEQLYLQSADSAVDADTSVAIFGGPPTSPGRMCAANWHRFLVLVKPSESLPFEFTDYYRGAFPSLPSKTQLQQASFRILAVNQDNRWPGLSAILPLQWV